MKRHFRRWVRSTALALGAWTVVGLVGFGRDLVLLSHRDEFAWRAIFAIDFLNAYIFFLVTPFVFWLGRRYPVERLGQGRRLTLHAVLGSGVALLITLIFTGTVLTFGTPTRIMKEMSFAGVFRPAFFTGFHVRATTYWLLILIQQAWNYRRRSYERERRALRLEMIDAELKTQLTLAELRTLRMQLQPHFLFNVLNSVMVLVRRQEDRRAVDMLCRLKDLLRLVLDGANDQEVPLGRELELIELYLTIERVRFQDRLRVEMAVDPELLDAAVPSLCLQPLVENAIRHGVARQAQAGAITIRAFRIEHMLRLEVQDNGSGLDDRRPGRGNGIGLANTRVRLRQLYGDASRLSLATAPQSGTIATIDIPYHSARDVSAMKRPSGIHEAAPPNGPGTPRRVAQFVTTISV